MTTLIGTGVTSREELIAAVVSSTHCPYCQTSVGKDCFRIEGSPWFSNIIHLARFDMWTRRQEKRQMISPTVKTVVNIELVFHIASPATGRDVQDTLIQITEHMKEVGMTVYDDSITVQAADDQLLFKISVGKQEFNGIKKITPTT